MGGIHSQVYAALPRAKVTAIVDEDVAGAQAKAKKLGFDVPVLPDVETALRTLEVDVVDICVPTLHHPRYIRAAIRAARDHA